MGEIPGQLEWIKPVVLTVELFLLIFLPFYIFTRSGLFPRQNVLKISFAVAAIFYLALPDPINIGIIDDLLAIAIMGVLFLPQFREKVFHWSKIQPIKKGAVSQTGEEKRNG